MVNYNGGHGMTKKKHKKLALRRKVARIVNDYWLSFMMFLLVYVLLLNEVMK